MDLTLRSAEAGDAQACGTICYQAFKGIAERHGFSPDFPSPEAAIGLLAQLIEHPRFYAVVAERDGRIIGSNFVDERSPVAGIGPVTVAPEAQDESVGRQLMTHVVERARRKAVAVRLTQAAYHGRSLSLYAKLGFEVREPLAVLQGSPPSHIAEGITVSPAQKQDLTACNALCESVHGHHRGGELEDAIAQGAAMVARRDGQVTAYATLVGYFGHAVARSNDELKALIASSPAYPGPGFLLPMRNGELLQWCLQNGLRITHMATLMSLGRYQEPRGAFLPSILY